MGHKATLCQMNAGQEAPNTKERPPMSGRLIVTPKKCTALGVPAESSIKYNTIREQRTRTPTGVERKQKQDGKRGEWC